MKNPGKVRARTYGTKSPSRLEALRFIDSAKSPSTLIGLAIWSRRFEPGLFQGFSRHLASRHLNLSRYSHVLLCRTQANSSHSLLMSVSQFFRDVALTCQAEKNLKVMIIQLMNYNQLWLLLTTSVHDVNYQHIKLKAFCLSSFTALQPRPKIESTTHSRC